MTTNFYDFVSIVTCSPFILTTYSFTARYFDTFCCDTQPCYFHLPMLDPVTSNNFTVFVLGHSQTGGKHEKRLMYHVLNGGSFFQAR